VRALARPCVPGGFARCRHGRRAARSAGDDLGQLRGVALVAVDQLRGAVVDPFVQRAAVGGEPDLRLDQAALEPVERRRVVPGDRGVPQGLQPGERADQALEGQAGVRRRAPRARAAAGGGQAGQVPPRVAAVQRAAEQVEAPLDELPPVADPLLLLPQRLAQRAQVGERLGPLNVDSVTLDRGILPVRPVL
jgi:hypothetical protein